MLPYGRQSIDQEDIDAMVAVLRSDWLTTGPAVSAFEEAFAREAGAAFAVAVSSGTAALHAAVYASGVGHADEVVVPAMTFAATANCVRFQGAAVVFADVRTDTLNLDPEHVERVVSARTKAIIAVDYTGQPADLDELRDIARRHRLILIEDAAHALGAEYHGRRVGGIADLTAFSLHPVKLITTGEGGVVTTNDPAFAERMRVFRNHGITADHHQRAAAGSHYYEMVDLGYNYRITDFQCALGLRQLRKLPTWLKRRAEIAKRYNAALADNSATRVPCILPDRRSAWHLYVLRLELEHLRATRDEVLAALRAENIGANVHYIPVPWHPYYQRLGYKRGSWPVSEEAYRRIITLPIFPAMTDTDIEDVIGAVEKVLRYYAR